MAIDERTRHELFLKLEHVLGPEEATTLMEHLPPVGWADVATKRDLDQLAVATKRDIDQLAVATKRDIDQLRLGLGHLEERFDQRLQAAKHEIIGMFRAELNSQTRTMMLTMSGLMVSLSGLAFAAARLT